MLSNTLPFWGYFPPGLTYAGQDQTTVPLYARRLTDPAQEPITLAEARTMLRLDVPGYSGDTMQDSLLQSWIAAARATCQMELDKFIGAQTFILTMASFSGSFFGDPDAIVLPTDPIRSVDQISYRATDDTTVVMAPTDYMLTGNGILMPAEDTSWPDTDTGADAITIRYTAGMRLSGNEAVAPGDREGVEILGSDVLAAMRLLIGHFWFERKASVEQRLGASLELPLGVKALLWPNRRSVGL